MTARAPSDKEISALPVCRITVDEVLGESTIRVLVAALAKGAQNVSDDSVESWDEETAETLTRDGCLEQLGLGNKRLVSDALKAVGGVERTADTAEEEFWCGLREGQVFLIGNFAVDKRDGVPQKITVDSSKRRRLIRIDRLEAVKKDVKRLYAEALAGREGSDA